MAKAARELYEQAVRDLSLLSSERLSKGESPESVARMVVEMRNDLKVMFRKSDPPSMVKLIERRNIAKYGNPVGPGPEWLYKKYGSWELVIEAACRPFFLSKSL